MAPARRLVVPIYLPWAGMSLSLGMVSLALPLYLTGVGFGYLQLSVVLTAAGLGSMITGMPLGGAVARIGERAVLVGGFSVLALTTALLAAEDQVVGLAALQLLAGVAGMAIRLGTQTWITRSTAPEVRGRLLSVLGGLRRLGMFVGPFVAGLSIDRFGFTATFVAAAVVGGLGLVPLLGRGAGRHGPAPSDRVSLVEVLRRHGMALLRVSSGPVLIMAGRRGRVVVLPLIAADLGLGATAVGVMVSISTGADLMLFPVSGWLMDRFGRLKAIVPAFGLMALGLVGLGLADGPTSVALAGALIGIGNGLSSGTMLTLGSDLAPEEGTGPFLAGFASLQDWGQVLGPLLVGWVAARLGLSAASAILGLVVLGGVSLIVVTVGETLRRAGPDSA